MKKGKKNNCKLYVGIIIVVLLILVGVFFGICGLELQCFRSSGKNSTVTCDLALNDIKVKEKVKKNDDLMLITNHGTLVRTTIKSISQLGRNTQGVRLIKLSKGEKLSKLEKVEET